MFGASEPVTLEALEATGLYLRNERLRGLVVAVAWLADGIGDAAMAKASRFLENFTSALVGCLLSKPGATVNPFPWGTRWQSDRNPALCAGNWLVADLSRLEITDANC